MKKVVGLVFGLLPVTVSAECLPVPDCTTIGYTETSCDGDSLKCPFDTTKLRCLPCASSFRYTCTGDNIKNPIGDSCNNKYVSCECEDRTIFTNGECLCDTSCDIIGNIYYSDGTCSSCNLSTKTAIGVIAYKNENKRLIVSLETNISMTWSADQLDAEGNIIVAQHTDIEQLSNQSATLSGFDNTKAIVEAYGKDATGVAAIYCYNYAPPELETSQGQWHLPSREELYGIVYTNRDIINSTLLLLEKNILNKGYHWSSSEYNQKLAWIVASNTGYTGSYGHDKNQTFAVSCIKAI